MSDLRAPDPTLVDLHAPVAVDQCAPYPATAHRMPGAGSTRTNCGYAVVDAMNSLYAAYVAVPCRECFPDAPEPGHRCPTAIHTDRQCRGYRDPHLAWQVPS